MICLDLPGSSKVEVIEALLDVAMRGGRIRDRQAALDSLLERERKMSTGMQCGIAIPHGKTACVDELVACIGIKPDGIDFEALDNQPCTIFVMTLSPVNQIGPHIQFLGEVSRLLRRESARKAFLEARTPAEILALFEARA